MARTRVIWEQWHQTFFHPCYPAGVYEQHSQDFETPEEARGFALGLKSNARVRDIHVRPSS